MNDAGQHLGFLRDLTWSDIVLVLVVPVACGLLVQAIRRIVRGVAESAPSHRRLLILRITPLVRLLVWIVGVAIIVPVLIEPNLADIVALIATVGLALAFALKDYLSCLIAGIVTILENTYQPGDWIEIDSTYGEVKTIGIRAVHIATADDTEVIIPHSRLWSASVANASSGNRSLLCVTNFYLQADHDGAAVSQTLIEVGEASIYRKPDSLVKVVAAETPVGTCYKIKAYVNEGREQFVMITDLTIRGKERLREMGVAFAQARYVETRPG